MPSWRPDTAKQRLWLGSDRDRRSCRDTVAYAEPESYAHSNGYAFGVRSDVTHSNADCDSHTHCHVNSYSYCDAQSDPYAEIGAITKSSSNSSAKTISPTLGWGVN